MADTPTPEITQHGTPEIARKCDCWRCSNSRPWTESARRFEPKWDIGPLLEHMTEVEIKEKFGYRYLIAWKNTGLTDAAADYVATRVLKVLPYYVWEGWTEAGLDYYPPEDDDGAADPLHERRSAADH